MGLCDEDDVYRHDMHAAGLPACLLALLSVYQAQPGLPELRPIAAQMARCGAWLQVSQAHMPRASLYMQP